MPVFLIACRHPQLNEKNGCLETSFKEETFSNSAFSLFLQRSSFCTFHKKIEEPLKTSVKSFQCIAIYFMVEIRYLIIILSKVEL